MTRTWMLVLEYEGTRFHGWQVQPNVRTVQGELRDALTTLLREPVMPGGAGRTDAGVHAEGQVASFRTDVEITPTRIASGVHALTGDDLTVRAARHVADHFDARRSARRRIYRYRLLDGHSALQRRTTWRPRRWPDPDRLQEAADRVLGAHDFTSFAATEDASPTKHCHLHRADWRPWARGLEFTVEADRFLHHMVRNLVGTMMEIGVSRRSPDDMDRILAAHDRREAGPTAPASGLTLVRIDYDPKDLHPPT